MYDVKFWVAMFEIIFLGVNMLEKNYRDVFIFNHKNTEYFILRNHLLGANTRTI